jgi:predicted nucleotidyltransferase component of viral defense system
LKDTVYFHQANLVLDILPLIDHDKRFALKGGTAINYFVRPLPRLSVDIDLVYLPIENREQTLYNIGKALDELAEKIRSHFSGISVHQQRLRNMKHSTSLIVIRNAARIKIEPNLIIRGSVFPVFNLRLVPKAEDFFNKSVKIQLLATADLYGGKLCAALDRQHPRDLFDVMLLFNNEGITNEIRQAFIIYLISHNRPMIELLKPNVIDIDVIFNREFKDMTFVKVSLTDLKETRKILFNTIKTMLTADERKFLLSVKYK